MTPLAWDQRAQLAYLDFAQRHRLIEFEKEVEAYSKVVIEHFDSTKRNHYDFLYLANSGPRHAGAFTKSILFARDQITLPPGISKEQRDLLIRKIVREVIEERWFGDE